MIKHAIILLTILTVIILAGLFYTDQPTDVTQIDQVTDQTCDAQNRCDEGYQCVEFPTSDGPLCATDDVFDHFRCPIGTQMLIQERYPPIVVCSPTGILGLLR